MVFTDTPYLSSVRSGQHWPHTWGPVLRSPYLSNELIKVNKFIGPMQLTLDCWNSHILLTEHHLTLGQQWVGWLLWNYWSAGACSTGSYNSKEAALAELERVVKRYRSACVKPEQLSFFPTPSVDALARQLSQHSLGVTAGMSTADGPAGCGLCAATCAVAHVSAARLLLHHIRQTLWKP